MCEGCGDSWETGVKLGRLGKVGKNAGQWGRV